MRTVAEFVDACRQRTHDEIYSLFEDEIPEVLRDEVLAFADLTTAEPVRSAFNRLGKLFNVVQLEAY